MKLGQLYKFKPIDKFLLSHASNPLAIHIESNIFRVFFSGRDKDNKSSVGYVDVDILKHSIIGQCAKTVFKYGDKESFYSHGVSIGNIYEIDDIKYIQFMGWQIKNGEHWRGDIGRLRVNNTFEILELDPHSPHINCDEEDKISLSYSWVMFDEGIFKMWYGSTLDWSSINKEMIHVIKYATSKDGKHWDKHGLAVPYELGIAQAFSRPTVIKDQYGYHMWFSYRSGNGTKYKIGYAFSNDGKKWDRKKDSGITCGTEGEWDCEMICYPFVFEHNGNKYMLYNGNDFGREGFGLAIMEEKK